MQATACGFVVWFSLGLCSMAAAQDFAEHLAAVESAIERGDLPQAVALVCALEGAATVEPLTATIDEYRRFNLRSCPPEPHHREQPRLPYPRQAAARHPASRAFCPDVHPQRAPRPGHELLPAA